MLIIWSINTAVTIPRLSGLPNLTILKHGSTTAFLMGIIVNLGMFHNSSSLTSSSMDNSTAFNLYKCSLNLKINKINYKLKEI